MSKKKENCEGCDPGYTCGYCGKEYSREDFYLKHIEKCKNKPSEDLEQIEEFKDIIIEEEVNILTTPEILPFTNLQVVEQEMVAWFNVIGGRPSANAWELGNLVRWYQTIFPTHTLVWDISCASCMKKLYKRLLNHYNGVKENYNKK